MMKEPPLSWKINKADNKTTVIFEGRIDQFSTFPSPDSLQGIVDFDLAGIVRMTSSGIRLWIAFLDGLTKVTELAFDRCSVHFINQLNMIEEIGGEAEIRSFFVPYCCQTTGRLEDRLMTMQDLPDPLSPPSFPCPGGTLELADLPEQYFAFLLEE